MVAYPANLTVPTSRAPSRTAPGGPPPQALQPGRVAATPIAFVQAIVRAYERDGLSPAAALRQAQITPRMLADPRVRVTAEQFELLAGHAMRELDDEALGWFSRKLPWGTYGMLCRASLSSPTLGVALKRWCRHHALLTPDVQLVFRIEDRLAHLDITEHRAFGGMREFCLVSTLRFVHGFACWAIDSRIGLASVRFPFAAPPHHAVHGLIFPGPVTFGTPQAGFSFDTQYLALPMRRDEDALRQMLRRALPLTVLQYRRDRLLVPRIGTAMREHLLAGLPVTATALARATHVSPRTLHRQLREEGASLQGIKDQARRAVAEDLLARTDRPVKQVAEAAGFANVKSFARAFKAWTGHSPAHWRAHG